MSPIAFTFCVAVSDRFGGNTILGTAFLNLQAPLHLNRSTMVSVASFISATAVAVVGCLTTQVQAHGYMLIPLTEFKGTATGAWIVQISPQFNANWEFVADDTELIALYVEKAKEAGYANNIRKLLDSDTNLYGADCGFSNPDAKPKDPPTDGTATFERGLAHHVRFDAPSRQNDTNTTNNVLRFVVRRVHAKSGWMTRWCCITTTVLRPSALRTT